MYLRQARQYCRTLFSPAGRVHHPQDQCATVRLTKDSSVGTFKMAFLAVFIFLASTSPGNDSLAFLNPYAVFETLLFADLRNSGKKKILVLFLF